jgi:hypothetical protein
MKLNENIPIKNNKLKDVYTYNYRKSKAFLEFNSLKFHLFLKLC